MTKQPVTLIFFVLHLSMGEEMWYSNTYQLFSPEEQLHDGQHLHDQKTLLKCPFTLLRLFVMPSSGVVMQASSIGKIELLFQGHSWLISSYNLLVEIRVIVSGVEQILCNFSTKLILFMGLAWIVLGQPWHEFWYHMFHSKSSKKTQYHETSTFSNSCTVSRRFLFIAACTNSIFLGILLVECLPEYVSFTRFLAIFIPHFNMCITHWVFSETLLSDSVQGQTFKFYIKFNINLLI